MFEQALTDKFKKVFALEKVVFATPAPDDKEQKTLFIEVTESRNTIRGGTEQAKVTGKAIMFAENEQIPYGFFSKAIEQNPDDTKDLFFYDFEDNAKLHQNISQRGFSFIYFFSGQYNPNLGTINSIELEVTEI